MKKESHQSLLQHQTSWWGVQCPGASITQALWEHFFTDKVCPPWSQVSHFLCKLVTMCSLFWTFLEVGWRALEGSLVVLIPPYWRFLLSVVQAHFLSPSCICAVLITRSQNKDEPGKCCPTFTWPSPVLSHSVFLPTVLGWFPGYLAISVWDIHIRLSSRLLHGPAQDRPRSHTVHLRAWSKCFSNSVRFGAATTSLGSLCHGGEELFHNIHPNSPPISIQLLAIPFGSVAVHQRGDQCLFLCFPVWGNCRQCLFSKLYKPSQNTYLYVPKCEISFINITVVCSVKPHTLFKMPLTRI